MNFRSARFTRKLTLTRSFSAKVERARSVSPSNRMVLVAAVRLANSVHQGPLQDKGDALATTGTLESFATLIIMCDARRTLPMRSCAHQDAVDIPLARLARV